MVALADELGVLARDRHVVEEDLSALGAARDGAVGVQQEPLPHARTALDDQQGGVAGQRADGGGVLGRQR